MFLQSRKKIVNDMMQNKKTNCIDASFSHRINCFVFLCVKNTWLLLPAYHFLSSGGGFYFVSSRLKLLEGMGGCFQLSVSQPSMALVTQWSLRECVLIWMSFMLWSKIMCVSLSLFPVLKALCYCYTFPVRCKQTVWEMANKGLRQIRVD